MATLEQRGKGYRISFRYLGERHRFSLDTRDPKDAEACLARIEDNLRLIERGRMEMPPDADFFTFLLSDGKINKPQQVVKPLTLGELSEAYQDAVRIGSLEKNTRYTICLHFRQLLRTFGSRYRVSDISGGELQCHINRRSECNGRHGRKLSGYTIRKEIITLGAAYQWAVSIGKLKGVYPRSGLIYPKLEEKPHFRTWDEIDAVIARGGIGPEKAKELWASLYLTRQETEALLEFIRTSDVQPFLYPMVATAAHTGARRTELVRLQISDVQFETGTIHISEKKKAKGKSTFRSVPISPFLESVLKQWLARHPGGNDLFCQLPEVIRSKTLRGSPMPVTPNEAHHHLHDAWEQSKWKVVKGWHTLRHSFASNCAAAGVPEYLVSGWMGHQTQAMVQRYRHLFPSKQKQAIAMVFGEPG